MAHITTQVRELLRGAPGYPEALGSLPDAPDRLWVRGDLPAALVGRAVAIVGARRAGAAKLVAARAVAAGLAGAGFVVVSGGALGIDGAAHRGALDAGGRTVVVMGTGIDVIYPPRHAPLFDDVVAAGGAVVTEVAPGLEAQQQRWTFPRRNRIIAALAECVIVVEASGKSGALYTTEAALKLGRRVMVLRGSQGCDALAAGGAIAADSAEELVGLVTSHGAVAAGGGAPLTTRAAPAAPPAPPDDPRARLLYEALDGTPRDLGEVAARAGISAAEALAIAIDLEVGGLAARAAGGRYLRLG